MNWYEILLNKEVLTALISLIGLLALNYLGIPEDIWNGVFALLTVIIANMFVVKAANLIGRSIARGMRESLEE